MIAPAHAVGAGGRPDFLKGHLPALDGIRGGAVLAVMLYHFVGFGGMARSSAIDDAAFHVAMLGWTGVELFFVLSGFLITGILVDARGKRGFFGTFYARRSIRIFPLYFAALLLTYGVLRPLLPAYADLRAPHEGHPAWFWLYGSNILTAIGGWEAVPRVLQHFWSLAIEEQFYLAWPLLVYLVTPRTLLRVCLAIIVAGLVVRVGLHANGMDLAAYVLTPARMDGLAIGAALAVAMRDPAALAGLRRGALPVLRASFALLAVMILSGGGLVQFDPIVGTVGYTIVGIAFGSLLFVVVVPSERGRLAAIFDWPLLRQFGKYSYALYVFHQPVALALLALGFSASSFPLVAGSALPGAIGFALVAGVISVGAALLSWHLFEKRCLRLKDRFTVEPAQSGGGVVLPAGAGPATALPVEVVDRA